MPISFLTFPVIRRVLLDLVSRCALREFFFFPSPHVRVIRFYMLIAIFRGLFLPTSREHAKVIKTDDVLSYVNKK